MGYMRHHAIIVTSFDEKLIGKAFQKAIELFCDEAPQLSEQVSRIVESPVNSYWSFVVFPDGSKEGWVESIIRDNQRQEFINWLKKNTCLDWVEVQYGDEDHETLIVSDSDSKYRKV